MLYIFTAIYCEAEPLIKRYDLSPDAGYPFGGFVSSDGRIRLILTGVGKTGAAAAVAHSCARYRISSDDILINIGTCGGGTARTGAYLINKVIDGDSGRTFYPDMLYSTSLGESAITTVSFVATPDDTAADELMLWDMEASGFCDAARLFVPPHRIVLIKAVSDNGSDSKKDLDGELLNSAVSRNLDDIAAAIEVFLKIGETAVCGMPDTGDLAEEFKCSETMRSDLEKLIIYCRNSGRDHVEIIDGMRRDGILPAAHRNAGKGALNEFRRRLLQ